MRQHTPLRRILLVTALAVLGSIGAPRRDVVGAEELPVPAPCVVPDEQVVLASVAEAEARLVGTWIRCEGATRKFVAFEGDDIGFQFTADGRFYRIYPAADGSLIRAEGLGQEGQWRIDDLTDSGAAGFGQIATLQQQLLGSGFVSDAITFHDEPDAIGIPYAAFFYHRWPGEDPTPGRPAGIGDGPCGQPTEPVPIETPEQVESLLIGTWTLCGSTVPPIFGADSVGVEFEPDGRYWPLIHDTDGTVIRGGRDPGGTWIVNAFEPGTLTWGNKPQVDLVSGDGTRNLLVQFFASPSFVHVDNMGVEIVGLIEGRPPAAPPTSPAEPLPATGARSLPMLSLAAAVLVLAGTAARGLSRRRPPISARGGRPLGR